MVSEFVIIDGNEIRFEPGETVLEAAMRAEIEIPTLCYDPRLTPAGACRMCLVEMDGLRLMQPACSYKAAPGLVVRTQTPRVQRNREFILSLHLADTIQDRAVMEDRWQAGITVLGLAEDGVALALDEHNRALVSAEMEDALKAAEAKIVSGEIKVIDYMANNRCEY